MKPPVPASILSGLAPSQLRCESLKNPLGIDVVVPRLGWTLESTRRGESQTAYQILAATSTELLSKDQGNLWDSGKVNSDQMAHVRYEGAPLESRMCCHWKVRVWNKDGELSGWSAPALWTMGLLSPKEWEARWIGCDGEKRDPAAALAEAQWVWLCPEDTSNRVRWFRRTIDLPAGRRIAKACGRMTADRAFSNRGCQFFVNGKKAEARPADVFGKGFFDFADLLREGENTFAVEAQADAKPDAFLGSFFIEFDDGAYLSIATDAQWRAESKPTQGWETPGFDDGAWPMARVVASFGGQPVRPDDEDVRQLPARMLRREFQIEKKVVRATAYVCGLGFFEMSLNGKKVEDHLMDPGLTNYDKRIFYVTFDVTAHLKNGANALGVMLGNGRFFAPRLLHPAMTRTFGHPKLLLQLEIEYAEGGTDRILSDESWLGCTEGPITANNEYDGEEYDARLEMEGWDRPGFRHPGWKPVQLVQAPKGELAAQMIPPMRVTEVIRPVGITNPKPGTYIVDMGQAFYGAPRLKVKGPAGTTVKMTGAYSLQPDGSLKTGDNRDARCTDVYILKGGGQEEVWAPRFKGQGFRRLQVEGFPGVPTLDDFEGLVVHTDVEPAGVFECSNALINRIHRNGRWGFRMYFRSAPLDPDRDERQAWLGDPAKDAESEGFNFDVAAFYAKWMRDVELAQRADGSIPDIAMYWDWGNGIEWPSVFTIIPEWLLDFYGDRRPIETHYGAMKSWVAAMNRHCRPDFTTEATGYGDWCDAYSVGNPPPDGRTSKPLVSTAYHYNNHRIMARAARILGREEDERHFLKTAEAIKKGFNKRFFNPEAGTYESETQCSYLLPLAFDMVPAEHRAKVIRNLVDDIMLKHDGHAMVGLVGMQWLMQTLTNIGHPEVAYSIVTRTKRPSWGYMIEKGATTVWERWDSDTQGSGMNSEALLILAGNLDAWFYQTLAGINYLPEKPGFKHVILRPRVLGDLAFAKASLQSAHGRITSAWERKGERLEWNVTVPPNTTATVFVPTTRVASVEEGGKPAGEAVGLRFLRQEGDAAVFDALAGSYSFTSVFKPVC